MKHAATEAAHFGPLWWNLLGPKLPSGTYLAILGCESNRKKKNITMSINENVPFNV